MNPVWLAPALVGTAWLLVASNCSRDDEASVPASSSVPTIEVDSNDLDFDDAPASSSEKDNEDY